jgi:thioredoxin reductase (NADPH)
VPELDDHFQTAVPGQYLIGEVAGKPLVKNAANLGRAVIEHIATGCGRAVGPHRAAQVDVAIVGSGPGGLSAGLTCIRARPVLRGAREGARIIASTVARYPKGKLVMAEPSTPATSRTCRCSTASKEDLVAAWQRVVEGWRAGQAGRGGRQRDPRRRRDLHGQDHGGDVSRTAVVLATGTRGKPRLLAGAGREPARRCKSRLDDPDEFARPHVLVVGGGDSAVEAALSLADAGATCDAVVPRRWVQALQAGQPEATRGDEAEVSG